MPTSKFDVDAKVNMDAPNEDEADVVLVAFNIASLSEPDLNHVIWALESEEERGPISCTFNAWTWPLFKAIIWVCVKAKTREQKRVLDLGPGRREKGAVEPVVRRRGGLQDVDA